MISVVMHLLINRLFALKFPFCSKPKTGSSKIFGLLYHWVHAKYFVSTLSARKKKRCGVRPLALLFYNSTSSLLFHSGIKPLTSSSHVVYSNWFRTIFAFAWKSLSEGWFLFDYTAQWSRCQLGCSGSQNLPGSNYRRIICSYTYYMERPKILLY